MTDTTAPRSFADTTAARLISLAIAILIGALIVVYWGDDIRNLGTEQAPAIPIVSQNTPDRAISTALQNCLDQRVGDVDKMKAEGVISDSQYTEFRQRAEELCHARYAE